MKNFYLFIILIISNYSFSQEYFSFNDTIYNKKNFDIFLKKKEIKKKEIRMKFKANFILNRIEIVNDSVIKHGTLVFLPQNFKLDKIYNILLKPLPDFNIEKQKGGYFNSDSLKGKPTIINLWFSNCIPCIEEMPTLNALKEKYGDSINTIGITFQDRREVMLFNQIQKFDFEILINARVYIDSLGINGYPQTILLDKNNIVRFIPFGIVAKDEESNKFLFKELTKQLDELLKE